VGYVYKFSTDTHDYYMSPGMRFVKVATNIPNGRSDAAIRRHGVDAEDDPAVFEYLS
jgi:hypothetical protein